MASSHTGLQTADRSREQQLQEEQPPAHLVVAIVPT